MCRAQHECHPFAAAVSRDFTWLEDSCSPRTERRFLLGLASLVGIKRLALLNPVQTPSKSRRPDPGGNRKTQPLMTTVSVLSIEMEANARASGGSCMSRLGASTWPR